MKQIFSTDFSTDILTYSEEKRRGRGRLSPSVRPFYSGERAGRRPGAGVGRIDRPGP